MGRPRSTSVQELRATGATADLLSGTHLLLPIWSGGGGGGGTATVAQRYRLYIDGVDRTEEWSIAAGSTIDQQVGAPQTASVALDFNDGGTRPEPHQEIIIVEAVSGRRLFGGDIASIEETNPDGTERVRSRLQCAGYAARLAQRIVGAYYEPNGIAWTPATMVNDLLLNHLRGTGIRYGGGDGGSAFTTEVIIQYATGDQAIRQVLDPWGLDYFVDAYGALYIIDPTTGAGAAPFVVSQASGHVRSNSLTVKRDRSRLATRVAVRSDLREPGMYTDTFTSDESGIGFYVTRYRLTEKPAVFENDVAKVVAESGTGASSYDYLYLPDGFGVTRSAGSAGAGVEIRVVYPIPLQPVYIVRDAALEALYGIRETMLDVRDVYERDRWDEIAQGELARRGGESYEVTYTTSSSDYLRPGMLQTISHDLPYVPSDSYVIDSVRGTHQPALNEFWLWTVTASNRAVQGGGNAVRTAQRTKAALQQPQDRHRQVFAWDLAKTVDGLTNPGVALLDDDSNPLPRGYAIVTRAGFLYEVRLRFVTVTDTVQVDVLLERDGAAAVSIFANGGYIEYATTDTDYVRSFNFTSQPFALKVGDKLTAKYMTADAGARDGVLEIEQQG